MNLPPPTLPPPGSDPEPEADPPPILVLGRDSCEDTTRSREHLAAHGIGFSYRNHEVDPGADALIRAHNDGRLVTPTILIGDPVRPSRVLVEPSNDDLDAAIAEVARGG